jgi:hypothetical protein
MVGKIYGRSGRPVAHKGMALDPMGYVNREANKGTRALKKPSTARAGLAKLSIQRAAQRRLAIQKAKPKMLRG